MSAHKRIQRDGDTLGLPEHVTLDTIQPLIHSLTPILLEGKSNTFTMDWANVRSVDSAAVSLLLEIARITKGRTGSIRQINRPVALNRLIALYSLKSFLD